jgi:hypothetical protein
MRIFLASVILTAGASAFDVLDFVDPLIGTVNGGMLSGKRWSVQQWISIVRDMPD